MSFAFTLLRSRRRVVVVIFHERSSQPPLHSFKEIHTLYLPADSFGEHRVLHAFR